MESFESLLSQAEAAHGHLCAGQILGVRMAMLGCCLLQIDDPRGRDRKRLVTYVEIDRCATDAIGVVTGCRLGKRALKFRDWGKMAATFVDLPSGRAVRIIARESSKALARQMYPGMESKNQQQMRAYREMRDKDLFDQQWVRVEVAANEMPGFKGERVTCARCGEGINYNRFVPRDSAGAEPVSSVTGSDPSTTAAEVLCLSCADPRARYYTPL